MKVAFDSQIFCSQRFGGISRYFASVAGEMQLIPGVSPRVLAPLYFNEYLDKLPPGLVSGCKVRQWPKMSMAIRLASLLSGDLALRWQKPEIVHKTYYYPLPSTPGGALSVVTVYDMIHELFPLNYSARDPIRQWKQSAVERADHVICISEQTRRDLLALHRLPPEKVSVTYLGYDDLRALLPAESAEDFRLRVLGTDRPYLLFVGSRAGYKNFEGMLRAYAASPWLKDNFVVLCFGGGVFTAGERALASELGVSGNLQQVGGGDDTLAACYKHAALFVYPSLYEGFGIPPLEAMSLDCPVACSNTSSIPEVVGDAASLFNPQDTEELGRAMECVLNSSALAEDLRVKGRERCDTFSWRRCAEETVAIYGKLLGSKA